MTLYLKNINFVAVPKNGTISIENEFSKYAFDYIEDDHMPVDIVKQKNNKPCICSIRNPIEWIISYYKYMRYSSWFFNSIWTTSNSFDEFLISYMKQRRHPWPEPFLTQSDYIIRNRQKVDHIYRYENIENVFQHLEDSLSVKVGRPIKNKTIDIDVTFDPILKKHYMDFVKKDFDLYESIK